MANRLANTAHERVYGSKRLGNQNKRNDEKKKIMPNHLALFPSGCQLSPKPAS
jgi:hypothetical protein